MTLAGYGSVNTTENDRAKGVLTTDARRHLSAVGYDNDSHQR